MSNWFKKSQNWFKKNLEISKSRWSFSVEADVWVPEDENEENEREMAETALTGVLNKAEGDVSYTGIDSNVKFQIQFEPLKIR